jgi:hypothetical protein
MRCGVVFTYIIQYIPGFLFSVGLSSYVIKWVFRFGFLSFTFRFQHVVFTLVQLYFAILLSFLSVLVLVCVFYFLGGLGRLVSQALSEFECLLRICVLLSLMFSRFHYLSSMKGLQVLYPSVRQ